MKKTVIKIVQLLILSAVLVANSCSNKGNEAKEEANSVKTQGIEEIKRKTDNPVIKTKAKFTGVYLNSSGDLYTFEDESGKELSFLAKFSDVDFSFTKDCEPNKSAPVKFDNIQFEIVYQKQNKEYYEPAEGKEVTEPFDVLIMVKQLDGKIDASTNTDPIKAEDIKKGDKIGGFEVSKIAYTPEQNFTIELKGLSTVNTKLMYNEFEESWDLMTEGGQTIIIDGIERPFLQYINLTNMEDLKSALSNEQIQKVQTGKELIINIEIKNPYMSVELDKGRFIYNAGYLSLNK